jgi:hypothetical protein
VWAIEIKMQTFRYIVLKKTLPLQLFLQNQTWQSFVALKPYVTLGGGRTRTGKLMLSKPVCDDL